MARLRYVKFDTADYLADFKTGRLSLQAHGAYHLLLWHMWGDSPDGCTFPLDYGMLASIWRVPAEEAVPIVDELLGAEHSGKYAVVRVISRHGESFLHSKRLGIEAKTAQQYSEMQSEKGKRSGAVRRENTPNRGSTGVPAPVQPHHEPSIAELYTESEGAARAREDTPPPGDIAKVAVIFEKLTGNVAPSGPLVALCATYSTPLLSEAVKRAAEAGKPSAAYIRAIAGGLVAEGWKPGNGKARGRKLDQTPAPEIRQTPPKCESCGDTGALLDGAGTCKCSAGDYWEERGSEGRGKDEPHDEGGNDDD